MCWSLGSLLGDRHKWERELAYLLHQTRVICHPFIVDLKRRRRVAPFCPQRDLAQPPPGRGVEFGVRLRELFQTSYWTWCTIRIRETSRYIATYDATCNPNEEKYFTFPMTMDSIWRHSRRRRGGARANAIPKGNLEKPPTLLTPPTDIHKLISPYSEGLYVDTYHLFQLIMLFLFNIDLG